MKIKDALKIRFAKGAKPSESDFAALIDSSGVRYREKFVSDENQTVFNLSNNYIQKQNQIDVVVGGVPQYSPENFSETSPTSITLNEPLKSNIEVVVTYF